MARIDYWFSPLSPWCYLAGDRLERIAARLGPDRVLRATVLEDHRPEWMGRWRPALQQEAAAHGTRRARTVDIPQPPVLLPVPLRLATRGQRPLYQGALQLLVGPHRVEGGWWDRTTQPDGAQASHHVARDYWVAASEHAGVLWVFRTRLAAGETGWFLHGSFA